MSAGRENGRVTAPVSPDEYSDLQEVASCLTSAEGIPRKMVDVVKNALRFYRRAVLACATCQAGEVCDSHGTEALRATLSSPSTVDCQLVTAIYCAEFTAARGKAPLFSDKEGRAVKELLQRVSADDAAKLIGAAFSDDAGRKTETILTIAADPSRWIR